MKKQAYLIIAHGNWLNLKYLLESIDSVCTDIYIHIDKKVKNVPIDFLKENIEVSKVFFVPRLKVNWGGYSLIEVTYHLLKAAYSKGFDYSYYHLLSGVDMLLNNIDKTTFFFNNNYPSEFISFDSYSVENNKINKKNIHEKYLDRIKYYHLYDYTIFNKISINKRLDNVLTVFQKSLLRVNRLRKDPIVFQKGSEWFSITDSFTEYVISKESVVKKIFNYGECVDEMFLQTLIVNSEYISNLYSYDKNSNVRYIDWIRGQPYTFTLDDYEELKNMSENYYFSRKVNTETIRKYSQNTLSE